MSKNIVFEGWLTKSPPTKRIWRTKWRRRWFALRQSGELPGQYFLDYYADPNCKRPKGTINLDLCEQVDAGLHMERTGSGSLDPKLRGSVFTIQTQSRTYHLEADSEADMAKWVDAICRVCGLRAMDEPAHPMEVYQSSTASVGVATISDRRSCRDGNSSYIPISECVTGFRSLEQQTTITFEPNSIVLSTKPPYDGPSTSSHHMYAVNPIIRINNVDLSENESNLSEDECNSLNASQSNIPGWSVAKSFTKLAVRNNMYSNEGPPVPPRPPNTLSTNPSKPTKDINQGSSKVLVIAEVNENVSTKNTTHKNVIQGSSKAQVTAECNEVVGARLAVPQITSWPPAAITPTCYDHEDLDYEFRMKYRKHIGPRLTVSDWTATTPAFIIPTRYDEDEDDYAPEPPKAHYCNVFYTPPAVDRALKPRLSHTGTQRSEAVLQYTELDLPAVESTESKAQGARRKTSFSEARVEYNTVDFLKTEAFKTTSQDWLRYTQ